MIVFCHYHFDKTTKPLTSDSLIFPHNLTYLKGAAQTYSFPSTRINKHGILLHLLPSGRGRWTLDRGNGCHWCKAWGTIASIYAVPYTISWWSQISIVWNFLQRQFSTEKFHKAIGWWWHLFVFRKWWRGEETPHEASDKKEAPEEAMAAHRETWEVSGQIMPWSTSYTAAPLIVCGQDKWNKLVHHVSYKWMDVNSSTPCTPIKDQIFCNLGHHDAYLKTQKEMSLTWTNDGANGLSDPKCSEYYLIDCPPVRSVTCDGEILHGHSLSTKYVRRLLTYFVAWDVASQLTQW